MNKEAILRAADWLEANPDKHVVRRLAADAKGRQVNPVDPAAECFCATGRIIHELGDGHIAMTGLALAEAIGEAVGLDSTTVRIIWTNNDWPNNEIENMGHPDNRRGNPKVIGLLRKLAA